MSRAKQFRMKLYYGIYNVNSFSSLYLVRLGEQFFSGAVEIFSGKDGSTPRKKFGPYAYGRVL